MKKSVSAVFAFVLVLMLAGFAQVPVFAADASAAADKAPAAKVEKKEAKYIGNSATKKFHMASCRFAKEIKPENAVPFASKAAAKKAGYTACDVCVKQK